MIELEQLLRDTVPPLMQRWDVPGVAVGASIHGERTLLGFGVTNTEHPLPVDADTIFQIGSISKTFLAAIVARLVEVGRLDLDDKAAELLPGSGLDPRIRVRDLLTHSSGIPGDRMILDAPRLLANGGDDSLARALDLLASQPLEFEPGTEYSYSNAGIMVAAAIVESLTAQPYPQVLRNEILGPAGMTRTFTTADEAITHRVAAPHGLGPEGGAIALRDRGWQRHWQLPGWDVPGGGILSNIRDMISYGEYILQRKVPASLFARQRSRGTARDHIGLVWNLDQADEDVVWHTGLTTGYCARMVLVPARELAYVILTNSTNGQVVHREVHQELLRTAISFPAEAQAGQRYETDLDDFEGEFDAGIYGVVTLRRGVVTTELEMHAVRSPVAADQFALDPPSASRVVPCSSDELLVLAPAIGAGGRIGFVRAPDGQVTYLRIGGRLARRRSQ